MKLLILIRGLPGSGKSTLAEILWSWFHQDDCICVLRFEADDYFHVVTPDGSIYNFNAEELPKAHEKCQENVWKAMKENTETIIVSNTFTMKWEMDPYYHMAATNRYKVQEIICKGDFGNTHACPQEKIEQMRRRFEYA